MKSLITIIIPVYNVEPYLRQCVDSVLHQTFSNLEIILVDDGSPDRCPEICDEYTATDARIKVIHQENQGLSAARNTGLDNATGEFIYFLDSDDYLGSSTISDLYNSLKGNEQIAIAIGYYTAVKGEFFSTYSDAWLFEFPRIIEAKDFANRMLMELSNHAATAKLYRKELFQILRFQLNKKNEDVLFEADLIPIIEANQYKCIDVPIYSYFYRQHDKSICHSSEDPIAWHVVENCDAIINKYRDREEIVSFLRNRQINFIIIELSKLIKEKKFNLFKEKKKYLNKFVNHFVKKHHPFNVFIYFLLLKYIPYLLIIKEIIKH